MVPARCCLRTGWPKDSPNRSCQVGRTKLVFELTALKAAGLSEGPNSEGSRKPILCIIRRVRKSEILVQSRKSTGGGSFGCP
jgi:hypothetical protein